MSEINLCFIATNFNNSHHSIAFVKSILGMTNAVSIVIVDNASEESEINSLRQYTKSLGSNVNVIYTTKTLAILKGSMLVFVTPEPT